MTRILTGIQSSGRPHLGNLLGAILPAIRLSQKPGNESFFFIADMHSLTTIRDTDIRTDNVRAVAAAWIAFGFDTEKNYLYRQSHLPEVCELAWYLNCFTPYPMLANAHSFKDKASRLADVNAGIFTYPVLMTADIVLYDGEVVPVGKDQKQHLEMARDIAQAFNIQYGNTLVVPEAMIQEEVMTIPGVDGQKMSKSYNNIIDIFLPEKQLRKQIMSIVTDSTPVEAPKNPSTDTTFTLYSLICSGEESEAMRHNYLNGGYGYGDAKQALYELILSRYEKEREAFAFLMNNPTELDKKLEQGEGRARVVAHGVMDRVRKKLGFA